jgi:hypothetical protein
MNNTTNTKNQKFISFKVTKTIEKPKTLQNSSLNNGRWTFEEHKKFVDCCISYGSNWKKVIKKIQKFLKFFS